MIIARSEIGFDLDLKLCKSMNFPSRKFHPYTIVSEPNMRNKMQKRELTFDWRTL